MSHLADRVSDVGGEPSRRRAVLESALETFSRFGYRKTSMDDVARAARISRQGLYFLFASKPALLHEAITYALDRDLRSIARELESKSRPLSERLVAAFALWGGSYIGPLGGEVLAIAGADPTSYRSTLEEAPRQFRDLVVAAAIAAGTPEATERAHTLISASIGIKHTASTREDYLAGLDVAVRMLFVPQPADTPR